MADTWMIVGVSLAAGALLFWLGSRLHAQIWHWREARQRRLLQDVLKHLLHCRLEGRQATLESIAGAIACSRSSVLRVLEKMQSADLVRTPGTHLELSDKGQRFAWQVLRAHRLWERYLVDEARMPLERVHHAAERVEHHLTEEEVKALDERLGHPRFDPHGDPIPQPDGTLERCLGLPLTDWPIGVPARIMHVEDEPEAAFKQIVAMGFRPGGVIRVVEMQPDCLVITDGQKEHRLAPIIAANVEVADLKAETYRPRLLALSRLPDGGEMEIVEIDKQCQGFSRRRMLDFGLTPGTKVRVELSGLFGATRAYRVRGTLIALRNEQAALIRGCVATNAEATPTAV